MKRLSLWVLGVTVAVGILGAVRFSEAQTLPHPHARPHASVRPGGAAPRADRGPASERPARPARPHSGDRHRAPVPRGPHTRPQRTGGKSHQPHALSTPSGDVNRPDFTARTGLPPRGFIPSVENPTTSGRGPPTDLTVRSDRVPAASPTSSLSSPLIPTIPRLAGVPFRGPVVSRSHSSVHTLARRPKGAAAGDPVPFTGGVP